MPSVHAIEAKPQATDMLGKLGEANSSQQPGPVHHFNIGWASVRIPVLQMQKLHMMMEIWTVESKIMLLCI